MYWQTVVKMTSFWLLLMPQYAMSAGSSLHVRNKVESTAQSQTQEHSRSSATTPSTLVPSGTQRITTNVPNLRIDHSVLGLGAVIPDVAIVRFIPTQSRRDAAAKVSSGEFQPIGNTSVYYSVSQLNHTSPAADAGKKWWAYQISNPSDASAPAWGVRPLNEIRNITRDGRLLLWVTIKGEPELFTPEEQSQGYDSNAKLLQITGTKKDIYLDPNTWFKPLCTIRECPTMTSRLVPAPVDDWYPELIPDTENDDIKPTGSATQA